LTVHHYSGKVLAHEEHFDKNIRAKYGAPFLDLHRVDLQLALYERAKQLGVRFRLGERVTDVNSSQAKVTTENGLEFTTDLIIAADGLWSRCRACFTGSDDVPYPTGDLAYRVVLDIDQVTDPELRLWISQPKVHFWVGSGAHAAAYSLRAGRQYNIVLLVPDDLPEGVSRQAGSVAEMKEFFKNWDPTLSRLLGLVNEVEKWKLMHSRFCPWWFFDSELMALMQDTNSSLGSVLSQAWYFCKPTFRLLLQSRVSNHLSL
jgi:salicylate hydroxylase